MKAFSTIEEAREYCRRDAEVSWRIMADVETHGSGVLFVVDQVDSQDDPEDAEQDSEENCLPAPSAPARRFDFTL